MLQLFKLDVLQVLVRILSPILRQLSLFAKDS